MDTTRRRLLGTAAASIAIAGCLGGDDGAAPSPTETEPEPTDTPSDEGNDSATVQSESHSEHGEILVGPDGMTLYMFDPDEQGEGASTCSGDCADTWPPLTVEGEATAGEGVSAALTTFDREDGSTQVAANGWPLYYFAGDDEPGDASGQGVSDVWWVLDPDGTPIKPDDGEAASNDTVQVRSHPDLGDVLVGPEGMTLYMFDQDEQSEGTSSCSDDCLENWPPLAVEDSAVAGDGVTAELTTFDREDGSTQVAANGWPLYYFVSDEEPGDVAGQGVGDVWWALDPDGVPIKPGDGEETTSDDSEDGDGNGGDGGNGGGYYGMGDVR